MKKRISTYLVLSSLLLLIGQGCVSLSGGDSTSGPAGMFVSTNKGDSWTQISRVPSVEGVRDISGISVYRLFEDPQDPDALYWASRGNGLFYTYDAGVSWQRSPSPLDTGFIYGVAVDPADKCTLFATNGGILYRSTDCNRSWVEVYRESGSVRVMGLAVARDEQHSVYAIRSNGDILISKDGGVSWKRQSRISNTSPVQIYMDPFITDRIYIATQDDGLYRSDDAGLTWTALHNGLENLSGGLEYRRFMVYPGEQDVLYYVSTYGIHVSEDAGESWDSLQLIHPPGSARIFAIGVNPNSRKEIYYAATINTRSTLYKSIDGGENWITKSLPTRQIPTAIHVHKEKNSQVYMGYAIPPSQ